MSSGAPLSVNVELIWRICAGSAIWRPAVSLTCVPMTCEVDSLQSEEPLINKWLALAGVSSCRRRCLVIVRLDSCVQLLCIATCGGLPADSWIG